MASFWPEPPRGKPQYARRKRPKPEGECAALVPVEAASEVEAEALVPREPENGDAEEEAQLQALLYALANPGDEEATGSCGRCPCGQPRSSCEPGFVAPAPAPKELTPGEEGVERLPGGTPFKSRNQLFEVLWALATDAVVRCDLPATSHCFEHLLAMLEFNAYLPRTAQAVQLAPFLVSFMDLLVRPLAAKAGPAKAAEFRLQLLEALRKHLHPSAALESRRARASLAASAAQLLAGTGERGAALDCLKELPDACDGDPSLLWLWIGLNDELSAQAKARLAAHAVDLHLSLLEPPTVLQSLTLIKVCWESSSPCSAVQSLQELSACFPGHLPLHHLCVRLLLELRRTSRSIRNKPMRRKVVKWTVEQLEKEAPRLFRAGVEEEILRPLLQELPITPSAQLRCLAEHLECQPRSLQAWGALVAALCSAGLLAVPVREVWAPPRRELWQRLFFEERGGRLPKRLRGARPAVLGGLLLLFAHFALGDGSCLRELLLRLAPVVAGAPQAPEAWEVPLRAVRERMEEAVRSELPAWSWSSEEESVLERLLGPRAAQAAA